MSTSTGRLIATAAAVVMTAFGVAPVVSAPAAAPPAQALEKASDGFIEVAKRRKRHYGGNAAALGAFAAIAGTIATLAMRDRYYRRHYYYDPYDGPPPYAYGYRAPYGRYGNHYYGSPYYPYRAW